MAQSPQKFDENYFEKIIDELLVKNDNDPLASHVRIDVPYGMDIKIWNNIEQKYLNAGWGSVEWVFMDYIYFIR